MTLLNKVSLPLQRFDRIRLFKQMKRSVHTSSACLTEEFENVNEDTIIQERPPVPIMTSRKVDFPNPYFEPKQAWIENMDTLRSEKLGILDLHPDVFGVPPRTDILKKNIQWQQLYKFIDYRCGKTRSEMKGSSKKIFPQKKTGKHRAGQIRAPQRIGGGLSHGPRGPMSTFYMLPNSQRVLGLRIALSIKYAQNDLHIVDNLHIPTDDPNYIQDLMDTRYWGFSCLFIDDTDIMPRNIALACSEFGHYNLMPVYGLNVYSMLKHETLVLTIPALEKIEKKLLEWTNKPRPDIKFKK